MLSLIRHVPFLKKADFTQNKIQKQVFEANEMTEAENGRNANNNTSLTQAGIEARGAAVKAMTEVENPAKSSNGRNAIDNEPNIGGPQLSWPTSNSSA